MQQVVDNQQLKDVLNSARRILLISGKVHNLDKICSMIALGQALEARKKDVTLLAEGLNKESFVKIPEIEQIKQDLEPRSLRVSINYGSAPVEKINYENYEGVFEVHLVPFPDTFSKDQIKIDYTGLDYDLILTVGAKTAEDFGTITEQYRQTLDSLLVINVDNSSTNTMFGKINLVDPSAETKAQLIYDIIKALGVPIDAITATLLLAGVMEKTKSMHEDVSSRLLKFSALLLDKNADWERALAAASALITTKPAPKEEPIKPTIPLAHKLEPEAAGQPTDTKVETDQEMPATKENLPGTESIR